MSDKLLTKKQLKLISIKLKKQKKKIILVHGVFDVVHFGHISHFQEAKSHGDILVVSITPDRFVKKGFNKPYFNKLVLNYDRFIKNNKVEDIVNPLISFDRKFESWDQINKSIILSIFSELEITKKEKIKILLNDYLNISKLLIPKKELGMINAIADKYINEKKII